ncbi:MAG: hypothetical protein ABDH37_08670, partial [Candidatus Hydrothermales bacterium]
MLAVSVPLYYFHLYEFKFIFLGIIFFILFFSFYNLRVKESFLESCNEVKWLIKRFVFHIKNDLFFLILTLFTILSFTFLFIFTMIYHPHGTDVYTYHIPVSARIAAIKGFPPVEFLNLNPHQFYFPKNMEILYSFYYIFVGTDKGILTLHFPFLFFGTLASFSLLRKIGVSSNKALYVISFLHMPIIPALSQTLKPDLEFSFLFLIFLSLLLMEFPYGIFFPLIVLSICCGIKYSVLVVFFIFLVYSFFTFIRNKKYIYILYFIPLFFVTSLHFYVFNFILKRNPFFPFIIEFFNIPIFKGQEEILKNYMGLPVYSFNPLLIFSHLFEFSADINYFYTYDNFSGGFGHYFVSLGFPFF